MTTKSLPNRRFVPLYTLGFTAIATLVVARLFVAPEKFDWPSWVQAVGSIAAILVAVWVSADQAEQQRFRDAERERAEIAGILGSLRAELATTFAYITSEVDPVLNVEPERAVRVVFPLPEYPFQIFDGLIPKLGLIPEASLQRQIIHTYALAKSLVMTTRAHNGLVEALDRAESIPEYPAPLIAARARENAHAALLAYGRSLRESVGATRKEVITVLAALDRAHPAQ